MRRAIDDIVLNELVGKMQENLSAHTEDKNNPHSVTAAQIGAAPAGYIECDYYTWKEEFVAPYCQDEEQLDEMLTLALNTMSEGSVKVIAMGINLWPQEAYIGADDHYLVRLHRGPNPDKAMAIIEGARHNGVAFLSKQFYRGEWTPLEWHNPPMEIDVEYRTTEKCQHKPVYTKLVSVGQLPASTGTISKDYCADTDVCPIRCSGYLDDNSTIPQMNGDFEAAVWAKNNTVYVETKNEPVHQYMAYVQVWYTK